MNLKLKTMATTALLFSLAAAPQALAATYTFTTVANSQLGGTGTYSVAERTINFYFTTDATQNQTSGTVNILGFWGTMGTAPASRIYNQTPGNFSPYYGTVNLGLGTPGVGRVTGLDWSFGVLNNTYTDQPFIMTGATYAGSPAGFLKTNIYDQNFLGGSSPVTITKVPEIDGGMLPRGLMVLSGVFLMLFGRKKAEEIA